MLCYVHRDISEIDVDNIHLCSDHFNVDCYEQDLFVERRTCLKHEAVPSIFTFSLQPNK